MKICILPDFRESYQRTNHKQSYSCSATHRAACLIYPTLTTEGAKEKDDLGPEICDLWPDSIQTETQETKMQVKPAHWGRGSTERKVKWKKETQGLVKLAENKTW